MKKLLAILLSVLLLTACLPLGAVSVAAATSGTTGDCTWTLDDSGHLIISGNGAMGDYDALRDESGAFWYTSAPWVWYVDSITSVTIEEGVTTIGDYAIYWLPALESVTIGNSVTTIGDHAFCVCTALESVTIGNSVTTIGPNAFTNCDSLTSVTIPDSVTTIGVEAFRYCDSLTSVTIGDSVTTIGNDAFNSCYSLTSVTIGDSVTTIEDRAFYYCDSLTDVYYNGTEADRANIAIGSYNTALTNATWHYIDIPAYPGDLNGDSRINNKDLGLLQQYLADWDIAIDLAACDLNGDGRVNNKDLGLLQRYLAGWDVTLG